MQRSLRVSLAFGHCDGDEHVDAIGLSSILETLHPKFGNGDGPFEEGHERPFTDATCRGNCVRAADVNNGTDMDAVAVVHGHGLVVLLGNGDGTLQAAVVYPLAQGQVARDSLGHLNGDAFLEAAIPSGPGVAVFLDNGDGTFGTATVRSPTIDCRAAPIADSIGGGQQGLATDAGGVSVFLGNGDGSRDAQGNVSAGIGAWLLDTADCSPDGFADIVSTVFGFPSLPIPGRGDGALRAPIQVTGGGLDPDLGEIDGDGRVGCLSTAGGAILQLASALRWPTDDTAPAFDGAGWQPIGDGSSRSVPPLSSQGLDATVPAALFVVGTFTRSESAQVNRLAVWQGGAWAS